MNNNRIILESEIRTILLKGLYEYAIEEIGEDAIKIFNWIDTSKYTIKNKFKDRLEDLTLEHLINEDNFAISNTLSNQIFAKAEEILPGEDPLYYQGIHFIKNNKLVKLMSNIIKRMPPEFLLAQVDKENKNYNNILTSHSYSENKNKVFIEINFHDNISLTIDGNKQNKPICNQYRGCLAGYMEVAGFAEYSVKEIECISEGADKCTYEMTWEKKPPLKRRIQQHLLSFVAKNLLTEMQNEATEFKHLVFNLEEQIEKKTKDYLVAKNQAENARNETELTNKKLESAIVKLEHLARYDVLTDIPNRQYFNEYFEQKWNERRRYKDSENKELFVMIADIDYFKLYNDTYGHLEGDTCLNKIAQTISKSLRKTDFVARYGGEEFVIILPLENSLGAKAVAHKIVSSVAKMKIPHKSSDVSPVVTISLGLAKMTDDYQSMNELLNKADSALYNAKDLGRNRYITYGE